MDKFTIWIPDAAPLFVHTFPRECGVRERVSGDVFVEEVDQLDALSVITASKGEVPLCTACMKLMRHDGEMRWPVPNKDADPPRSRLVTKVSWSPIEPPPPPPADAPAEARWNGQAVPDAAVFLRKSKNNDGGHVGVIVADQPDGETWTYFYPDVPFAGGTHRAVIKGRSNPNPPLLFSLNFQEWRDVGRIGALSARGRETLYAALVKELSAGLAKEPSHLVAHRILQRYGLSVPEPRKGQSPEAWYKSLPGVSLPVEPGPVKVAKRKPSSPGGSPGAGPQPAPAPAEPQPAPPPDGPAPLPLKAMGVRSRKSGPQVTRSFGLDTEGSRAAHLMATCPGLSATPEAVVIHDHKRWTALKDVEAFWDMPVCGQCLRMLKAAGEGEVLGEFKVDRRWLTIRDDGVLFTFNGLFGKEMQFIPRQDILETESVGPHLLSAARIVIRSFDDGIDIAFKGREARDAAHELLLDMLNAAEV